MNVYRIIVRVAAIPAAAIAGNCVGAWLHRVTTGRPAHGIVYRNENLGGRKVRSIPMSTTLYPALLCSAFGRPRWAYSFLGGLVVSLVAGDILEDRLMAWAAGRMPEREKRVSMSPGQPPGEKPTGASVVDMGAPGVHPAT